MLGKLLRIAASTLRAPPRDPLGLPLDTFVDYAALRMEVVDRSEEISLVQAKVQLDIDRAEGKWSPPMGSIERFAFYERAGQSYCVIATAERWFYGCFVLQKGVIPPE
jgi:L-fucose mutarotase